jgi:ribose transport system ATP-binding protein
MGTSVVYVSHRLDEIFRLADRVTVLRGGRVVDTVAIDEIDPRALAHLMVGEDVDPDYRAPVAARPDAPIVLEARGVGGRWLRGVDLEVHQGEILGIAGLAGAGSLELPYVLAGGSRAEVTGSIRLPQRSDEWVDASDAQSLGLPLVPADRQGEGVVAEFSVTENISLSVLGRLSRRFRLDKDEEATLVHRWTERLRIVTAGPQSSIATLSGGNQQKVVLARCLGRDTGVLLLCEPTAGVDIGTRVAIYELIADLAKDGLTVVVASSDEGDLLAMCTRIVVLRDGRVADEFNGDGLTQQALVRAIEGEEERP